MLFPLFIDPFGDHRIDSIGAGFEPHRDLELSKIGKRDHDLVLETPFQGQIQCDLRAQIHPLPLQAVENPNAFRDREEANKRRAKGKVLLHQHLFQRILQTIKNRGQKSRP